METDEQELSDEFKFILVRLKNVIAKFQPMRQISIGEFALLKAILDRAQEEKNFVITSSELSKILKMSKPATSRMMNLIEEKGYIIRYNEKKDRRIVFVGITEAGRKVFNEEIEQYQKFLNHIIKKMGQEEMEQFLISCTKLCDIMVEEMKNGRKDE